MENADSAVSNYFPGNSSPISTHPTPPNESWEGARVVSRFERVNGFDNERALAETILGGIDLSKWDDAPHISKRMEENSGPESVCGRDDRAIIENTKDFPWRAIAQILITFRNSSGNPVRFIGTGWFISQRTVATCGHCVYDRQYGWAQSIMVVPGRNGNSTPYGGLSSENFWSVNGWTKDQDPEYDYGAIVLPSDSLGKQTGYFGFDSLPDNILKGSAINTSGYPGDKTTGTQWFNAGGVTSLNMKKIFYMVDSMGGQSGSPTWHRQENNNVLSVGIHGYGGCPNSAARINKEVKDNLIKWR
ncbi:V8-like Glu-specific endopeptidase [Azospirillum brasilense]|uniref:Serine protease n=1 Tax=Azospirillum brasilense TaxID=192 RepID=A0A560CI38_AZOBR|nr:serine protease [Azospirillum brasilense]TWA84532.1 V8-like Glu-specific endopeptidase [Azospirillum brasilense]